MAKADMFEMSGVVTNHNRNIYEVEVSIESGDKKKKETRTVSCTLAGRLRKNFIRVLVGDKVTIQMSPYDMEKGIITYRFRN